MTKKRGEIDGLSGEARSQLEEEIVEIEASLEEFGRLLGELVAEEAGVKGELNVAEEILKTNK